MSWLTNFLNSNIGLKVVMALTGFILVGFVCGHMVGNLQVFLGPEVYNHYAAMLQGLGDMLWVIRLVLLTSVALHIYSATVLTLRSWAARPTGYDRKTWLNEDYAARTMKYGGVLVAIFIVYHLLHFTVGTQGIAPEGFAHCELNQYGKLECSAFANLVKGFQNVWVALFYMLAMVGVGLHLAHGMWSMFRTLGVDSPRYDRIIRTLAVAGAGIVTVGFWSIPLSVLFGFVHL